MEDIDPDILPWLTSSSLDEPPPDTAHGPYPLVVFSHGNGGMRLQSLFFTEYLASHGYVVIAPDHTYNTFLDNDDDYFLEVLYRRPLDLSDSFDWLVAQSGEAGGALAGCVDGAAGFAVSLGLGIDPFTVGGLAALPVPEAPELLGGFAALACVAWLARARGRSQRRS